MILNKGNLLIHNRKESGFISSNRRTLESDSNGNIVIKNIVLKRINTGNPDGGTLTIRTGTAKIINAQIYTDDTWAMYSASPNVKIEIIDSYIESVNSYGYSTFSTASNQEINIRNTRLVSTNSRVINNYQALSNTKIYLCNCTVSGKIGNFGDVVNTGNYIYYSSNTRFSNDALTPTAQNSTALKRIIKNDFACAE